jgi:wyosine [tRNA(Phe)-imidazoG37] synthetase (radical SAM superfamily)
MQLKKLMTARSEDSSLFIRTDKELMPSPGKKTSRVLSHLYGPVRSRRLGFSLGLDILPYKTCTFDCVYCQLGRTAKKSLRRAKYVAGRDILPQVKTALERGRPMDYITFSGSGEPTLNTEIGKIIRGLKKLTSVPVAVLTNSSLLMRKSVRQALLAADLVVPSLDAATARAFRRVNRPGPSISPEDIISGLVKFRDEFKGQIWLEVMLVKGVNDSPAEIKALKKAIARINPDKVQLNTVVRPPAEKWARPLSRRELEDIKTKLGGRAEVTADFGEKLSSPAPEDLGQAILSLVRRRPASLRDLAGALGQDERAIQKRLNALVAKGEIKKVLHRRIFFYELKSEA